MHRLPDVPDQAEAATAGQLVGSHDAHGQRIAVACSRFNDQVTSRLLDGALEALDRLGALEGASEPPLVCWVPGAFELPLVARAIATHHLADAVVCLGCVIRGETSHYDFVAGQCAAGLQRVQLDTGVPVVFGVLTTDTLDQALERSGGGHGNKGAEAVETAAEMINLLSSLAAAPRLVRSASDATA